MRFHVMTLFPDMVSQGLAASITGRALEKQIFDLNVVNIRIILWINTGTWTTTLMAEAQGWSCSRGRFMIVMRIY